MHNNPQFYLALIALGFLMITWFEVRNNENSQ